MTGGDRHAGGPGPDRRRPAGKTRQLLLAVIALTVLALDIVTKVIVVAQMTPGRPVPLIGDQIRFTLIRNPGAAFSMATGLTWVLTLVALLVVAGIIRYGRRLGSAWWAVGLGLVLGGALGNLVDRFFRAPGPLEGHVVDFIAVGSFPVFNLADSGITVGAILLAVLALFGVDPQGARRAPQEDGPDAADGPGATDRPGDSGDPGGSAGEAGGGRTGGAGPGGPHGDERDEGEDRPHDA